MTAVRSYLPILLVGIGGAALEGQAPLPELDALAVRLAGMTAVAGYEQAMGDSLLGLLPGASRDRAGNIVLTVGRGEPSTLIACPIDEPGFVVGGVRADGYVTLRRAGPSPGLLADQQFEGQRVTIWGRKGSVPGVVGVRSVHLTRGRTLGDTPFTFDDAFIDVGAESAAQVTRLGIERLAPVARAKKPHLYGEDLLAAPVAGRRAACAALVRASRSAGPASGRVTVAFVVEQGFTRRGLLTVARTLGPFDRAVLLEATTGRDPSPSPPSPDPRALPHFEVWGLRVRYPGTQVETVSMADAAELERRLRLRLGGAE
jgi:putative aminopeptidase FrvX